MRQTFETMGTVASLDIPDCTDTRVFSAAFQRLEEIDKRFSTYKPDSEVSLYQSGRLDNPSVEFKQVMAACRRLEKLTGGYFSVLFEGSYNPTGYVKGWAIAEAAELVEAAGFKTFALGIRGDVLAHGDKTWQIGIQDPFDNGELIGRLDIRDLAVASSGSYERGRHIVNPHTGRRANYWAGFTVIGDDIAIADALATAGFAAGLEGLKLIEKAGYQAIDVTAGRKIMSTRALQNLSA